MSTEEIRWESVDDPPASDASVVDDGLSAHNMASAKLGDVRAFACFARLPSGTIIGGALARTWGACCEFQQLWVSEEHRRRGIGERLVRLVEEHARTHGCSLVFLETFSFQAPTFYGANGYEVACELGGFPDGASKFIMRKELA